MDGHVLGLERNGLQNTGEAQEKACCHTVN